MSDFIPRTDSELATWTVNFENQLGVYSIALGVGSDGPTLVGLSQDFAAIRASITAAEKAKADARSAVQRKDDTRNEKMKKVRLFIQKIKTAPNYTEAIGQAMGIISVQSALVDAASFQPKLRGVAFPGHITLSFSKQGLEGVNIYARLKGEASWKKLSYDSHSPYVDNRELATPAQAENREYMCIGVVDDEEIGQQSDIVSIAFAG